MTSAQGAFFDAATAERLQSFNDLLTHDYATFLGFPAALDFDYSPLIPFTQYFLNNIGDPYVNAFLGTHTKTFEREVIAFFADLFRAPKDSHWGYVTNGSSECNLYALYVARQKYPQAQVYYSVAAHYSVPKNVHLLGVRGVPVATQQSGEMDYDDLRAKLDPALPAIIVATIGTTMTEAKDNVATIKDTLSSAGISDFFIHADAALAGIYVALGESHHPFDFVDGADSVNISGHKFIGCPTPCGVIIVRKEDKERLQAANNYTGSPDSTITGSRNGQTPLFLWYAITTVGREGFLRRAQVGQRLAADALARLRALGWEAWRNPDALTVMLKTPPAPVAKKWQLATADGWSHIICMPGVTQEKINEFIEDMGAANSDE